MAVLTFDELDQAYENYTSYIRCDCTFSTKMVGGQPADRPGVEAYVAHHLQIADPVEAEKAVQRILKEELQNVTPPEGELPEGKLYGLRAIRKTADGWPYLGDWMIKAAIKQATSRLYIFQHLRGSKGAFAEAGRVKAVGNSLRNAQPNVIYLTNPAGDGSAQTYYEEFMGRVQTPQGPVSIIHQSECVAPGSRFSFQFNFMQVRGIDLIAVRDLLAMFMIVGLGSARSLECGKFRVDRAEVELNSVYGAKPEKADIKPAELETTAKKLKKLAPPADAGDQPTA